MTGGSRRTAMRWLLATVVAFVIGAAGTPARAGVLHKGDRLAELDVAVDAHGKPFKLRSLRGKWVLVTIGAAWCKPCAKELPTWDKLAKIMKGKITFVAISVDDNIADGKKFHKRLKLRNMKLLYMPADKSAVVARYGAETMPSSFVADRNHVVRMTKRGFAERDQDGELKKMHAALDRLLKN
jgi:peroxiredoxin